MSYFDCYLIPVPAEKLEAYRAFSKEMARVYVEYGAVRIVDCLLDPATADGTQFHAEGAQDKVQGAALRDFPVAAGVEAGEVVVFSWTEWPDKQTRDQKLPLVLADPRVQPEDDQEVLFEGTRLVAGGFAVLSDIRR